MYHIYLYPIKYVDSLLCACMFIVVISYFLVASCNPYIEGMLPKGPYPPCLRMADRALLAGYPRYSHVFQGCYTGTIAIALSKFVWNKLEQLERLHSENTPTAPWLPILLIHIRSQVKKYGMNISRIVDFFFKVKAEKLQKCAKNWKCRILL